MGERARKHADEVRNPLATVSAPPEQQEAVKALSLVLARVGSSRRSRSGYEVLGPRGEHLPLPSSVFDVLRCAVEVMARGEGVAVVPVGHELTTQQAANLLNVSRQYLVRLLERGELAYTRTGSHRRLRMEDVLAYREKRDEERRRALDELAALSEEVGGYDEPGE